MIPFLKRHPVCEESHPSAIKTAHIKTELGALQHDRDRFNKKIYKNRSLAKRTTDQTTAASTLTGRHQLLINHSTASF